MGTYFFPTPYRDELLYSVIARYCIQSGNQGHIHNFDDLFRRRSVIASIEFQGRLEALISNMPVNSSYTSEYFIYNHTLFPYLASFVPEERAREVIDIMKDGDTAKIYNKIGLTANKISQNLHFKFCPGCVKEDIIRYGETYWHRIHQITGVLVCPIHRTPIYDSKVFTRGENRQSYIAATPIDLVIEKEEDYSNDTLIKLTYIAEDIHRILNKDYSFQLIKSHKYIYMDRLIQKDIANLNTMVHQKRLRRTVLEFWGEDVLNIIQNPIFLNKSCSWLEKLVIDSYQMVQPLRNILLARALDIDIIDLLDSNIDFDSIKSHKEAWENKLIELCRKELSLREIALALDSTSKTVKKHIERLNIEPFWKYNGGGMYINKPFIETAEFQERRDKARASWLFLIKENPGLSRNKLKKLDETLYTWLIRYDEEWVRENSPTIANSYEPMHWEQKDLELLPLVKKIVKDMKEGKPQRIRWSSIGGKLGINGWFLKNKDRMPNVREYIDSVEENLGDFQIRRIRWAIEELESEGEILSKWKLIEKSGVNLKYIEPLKNEIVDILEIRGYDIDFLL